MSRRKTYTDFGWEVRRVRVVLPLDTWAVLDRLAAGRGMDTGTHVALRLSMLVDQALADPIDQEAREGAKTRPYIAARVPE